MNIGWILTTLLIFTFLAFNPAHGKLSDLTFNNISLEQRLPGASVHSVIQDDKGIMWLGVESVGLCKYDGKDFTIYASKPDDDSSLSSNFLICMEKDEQGMIWIGTERGLNLFNPENETFVQFLHSDDNNGLPDNYINDIHVDKLNNIWIGTRNGLSKYNKNTGKFYNLLTASKNEVGLTFVSGFHEDSVGNLWIGSTTHGLFMIDYKTNFVHTSDDKFPLEISENFLPFDPNENRQPNYSIEKICSYNKENLLLGKVDGLYLFNMESKEFKKYHAKNNAAIAYSQVDAVRKDKNGYIWIGYSNQGLLLIDPNTDDQYYFNANNEKIKGLRSNSIRDIYEDKSGLIWIATKFHGIHTYDNRQLMFNNHPYNKELNPWLNKQFILSLIEDSKKNIWIGTKHTGLYKFNPYNKEVNNYRLSNSNGEVLAGNNRIECLEEDIFGNIWAGTENGIYRLSPNGNYKEYSPVYARTLESDKYGNIWVGTEGEGVFYYNLQEDKINRFESKANHYLFGNTNEGIRYVTITSDSLVWFCALQSGLYKYNIQKDEIVQFTYQVNDVNTISGNLVRSLIKDSSGKIWIGTKADGLSTYDLHTGKIERVSSKGRIPPKTIYSILEDNDNNLWMGTHSGLFKIDTKTDDYTVFTNLYGLKGNVFESNAKCLTHDGLIIFGGSEGLNVFESSKVKKVKKEMPIVISSIKLYDKTIATGINEFTEITISHDTKYMSINFALTDYSNPLDTRYKYILEGYDKDWISIGNRNYATYSSLPSGLYTFKVLGAYSDDEWATTPLEFQIKVTSPIWRKPWFIATLITGLFIMAFLTYWIRFRIISKNQKLLKKLVEARTHDLTVVNQELEEHKFNLESTIEDRTKDLEEARKKAIESDKLKSAFLANMSHEIRTPLNAIVGLTDILFVKSKADDEEYSIVQMIKSSTNSLTQLINDIIDISKIEANQLRIYEEPFALNEWIVHLGEIYVSQIDNSTKKGQLSIEISIPVKDIVIISDQIRIEQILKNLVNNSLKFTKKGTIEIGYRIITREGQEFIKFFVKDTGIGIGNEDIGKIFDRFKKSETKDNIMLGGTGLGLSISYNLTKILGGTIWVESELGKGSQFYVEIPLIEQKDRKTKKILNPIKQNSKEYSWKDKHILIAEDIDINFIVLENLLASTHVKLTRVVDGEEALKAVQSNGDENQFDLILMDIKMEKMDGMEATKAIKKINKSIPIIAQTAFAMDHEEKEILRSGFDGYISKPIIKNTLLEKIDEVFSISKKEAGSI